MSPQGGLFEARRSLVAGLGAGGIAVALASRSTVETQFGGVSIFVDRPFRVGDSIRFQAAHGIVGSIGSRSMRIRGPHGTLTTAPNAGIAKAHVTNLSMRSRFLFDHRVVLPPATGKAEVARVLAALLVGHPVVVKGGRIPWAPPARHPRLPRAPPPALYGRVNTALPFWRAKTLDAMTRAEWESLCDGCGRCCLHKLRDDDTDRIAFTNIACRLLDADTCRCKDYANRKRRVPDCVKLTPARIAAIDWLPPTCAYRLVGEGQDLPWWHPLVSGRAETVHEAGVSVRGRVVAEREAGDFEDHIVTWPGRSPARARTHGKTRKAG